MDGATEKPVKNVRRSKKKRGNEKLIPWLYDLVLWVMSVLIELFFREVHPRGAWKVPRTGPVILVAAPHANQVRALTPRQEQSLSGASLSIPWSS